jgi:hypothetical protein
MYIYIYICMSRCICVYIWVSVVDNKGHNISHAIMHENISECSGRYLHVSTHTNRAGSCRYRSLSHWSLFVGYSMGVYTGHIGILVHV